MPAKHLYKRIIALISAICIIISLAVITPVYSENTSNKKIRIGFLDNYGMSVDPSTGEFYGYTFDYFKEISNYTDWEYEFISCSWNEGMEMLRNGEIDIFGPMQKTPERETVYGFTNMNFGYEYAGLYTLEQNKIFYDDFEFFDGMRVGIEYDSPYISMMNEFCSKYNIHITYIPTDGDDIAEELKNNTYDVFLSGSLLDIKDTKVVEKIGVMPFYYCVRKDNTEVLNSLNSALSELQNINLSFSTDLFEKYYGSKSIFTPSFTKEETQILAQYPEINIGLNCIIPPLHYIDKNGNMTGMAIDILDKISEECGVKFNYSLISENPDADIIVFSDPENTPGNSRFTASFLNGPVVLIYKDGNFKTNNVKVAVSSLTFTDLSPIVMRYPDFEILQYPTSMDALDALKSGEADMAIASLYIFDCLIKDGNLKNYIAVPTDLEFNLRMQVTEKLPEKMVVILNKSINRIPDDEIDTAVFSSFTEYTEQSSAQRFISSNLVSILVVAISIVLIFLILILIILLITRSKKKALKSVAYYDSVTKLPSMLKFKKDISEILKNAASDEYMLVAIDIDKFAYINNLLGYETGNKILKEISNYLMNKVSKGTYISREMSDIFLFFLKTRELERPNVTDEKLIKKLEPFLGIDYPLTFSIGSYVIQDPSEDISSMIDKANCARKYSKHLFTNSFKEYTDAMESELLRRRKIHLNMAHAIEHNEFVPYLQAKTDLKTRTLKGAEVLVKWHTSDGEILQPASFIPIFEANGFIQRLDLYMFQKACQIIQLWEKSNITEIPRLSVNLSKKTLLSEGLCNSLLYYVSQYRIDIKHIELELTETAFEEDKQGTVNVINHLKNVGFIISLDDFGSGYSSFNMLKSIDVDVIKIDREFLERSLTTTRGNEIIHSIINLSKSLNIETVAEGVETEEQARLLEDFGCNLAQGFYFSTPTEIKAFDKKHFNINH